MRSYTRHANLLTRRCSFTPSRVATTNAPTQAHTNLNHYKHPNQPPIYPPPTSTTAKTNFHNHL